MTRFKVIAGSFVLSLVSLFTPSAVSAAVAKLSGTPIGTTYGFNYEKNQVVTDIQNLAFDGDLNTYFATNVRSYGWVGLDLGEPHIISRVGWAPRNASVGPQRVRCGIIQGANSPDFLDALPLCIIRENGTIGEMTYTDVNCSRGFRFVRFVSTGDSRCNIAELEFFGSPGTGDDSSLVQLTNLPTVIVNTVNAEEPYDKEHDITANIIIINENGIDTETSGTVRERGNASRYFPKKPWRLKFDKKQNILDAPAKAKKWTLINNYGDKTLMRNIVAFEIARRLGMEYVPYCQPVDVILNGEYKGCYQLCDQIEVNPGRVNITEMDESDTEGDNLTGGYFIEVDGYADDEPAGEWFITGRQTPVTIKSPDDGGNNAQFNYIKNYFQKMEELVFSMNYDPTDGYRSMLDTDSFLKFFMVQELSGNPDGFWSTYMYKDRLDPIFHTGPVWDFDIAFDNDYRVYPTNDIQGFLSFSGKASVAGMFNFFASYVINSDPQSLEDRARIWSLARNDNHLSADDINRFIDECALYLDESQSLNFKRWPILDSKVHMNPRAAGSYQGEINYLKKYISARFPKLDILMGYDPSISGVRNIPASPTLVGINVANRRVSLDGSSEFSIITPGGVTIYSGAEESMSLEPGLYIVRTVTGSAKIVVK